MFILYFYSFFFILISALALWPYHPHSCIYIMMPFSFSNWYNPFSICIEPFKKKYICTCARGYFSQLSHQIVVNRMFTYTNFGVENLNLCVGLMRIPWHKSVEYDEWGSDADAQRWHLRRFAFILAKFASIKREMPAPTGQTVR